MTDVAIAVLVSLAAVIEVRWLNSDLWPYWWRFWDWSVAESPRRQPLDGRTGPVQHSTSGTTESPGPTNQPNLG